MKRFSVSDYMDTLTHNERAMLAIYVNNGTNSQIKPILMEGDYSKIFEVEYDLFLKLLRETEAMEYLSVLVSCSRFENSDAIRYVAKEIIVYNSKAEYDIQRHITMVREGHNDILN